MNDARTHRIALVDARHVSQPATGSGWMVQCDFDGTISTEDVTDSLLQRFGRDGWEELEAAWERGEIGSRECMKGQVALLDMDRAELDAHLATIAVDPHFGAFVRAARERGMPVQVVSDGIDYAIHAVLERHGLSDLPVIANRLVQTGPRSWQLQSPWASAACARQRQLQMRTPGRAARAAWPRAVRGRQHLGLLRVRPSRLRAGQVQADPALRGPRHRPCGVHRFLAGAGPAAAARGTGTGGMNAAVMSRETALPLGDAAARPGDAGTQHSTCCAGTARMPAPACC